MLYFLYGPDTYRSKQKTKEITDGYKKTNDSGLNLLYIDAGDISFGEFMNKLNSQSMFKEKKLAVVSGVFSNKEFQEQLAERVEELVQSTDIVVVHETGKADERTRCFKQLQKHATCQEFLPLQPAMLRKWLTASFAEKKAVADPAAIDHLAVAIGPDLWRASQEVSKLAAYRAGKIVRKEDVDRLAQVSLESDIFKTIDALGAGDKRQAMALLKRHLDNGDNALYLLSMVAYQFRNFLVIKDLMDQGVPYPQLAKRAGLHPFVVQKSTRVVQGFSAQQLKRIYRAIFQADADIKTGRLEPELALDMLAANI